MTMTTRTFGRRGAPTQPAYASARLRQVVPAAVSEVENTPSHHPSEDEVATRDLFANIPLLTIGLAIFLALIFSLEREAAFDSSKGEPSIKSLIAFGAASYDLVLGSGEVWRVFLAPLLHSNLSHLTGNTIAMLCIGFRLEPLIGRGWFGFIFMASALGGVAGSLAGNPHALVTVGASGAITGLVGALFVVSFRPHAENFTQKGMRRMALFFGIPALAPLAFGSSGNVDYHAHLGGALVGVAIAFSLYGLWAHNHLRPDFGRPAGIAALAGLAFAVVSGFAVIGGYSVHAERAAQFVPQDQIDSLLSNSSDKDSADLVQRYPKDPRARLVRAVFYLKKNSLPQAEQELRMSIALSGTDALSTATRYAAKTVLALLLAETKRFDEAKTVAREICAPDAPAPNRTAMTKAKLCR